MLDKLRDSFRSTPESPAVDDMLQTVSKRELQQQGMEVIRTPQYNNVRVLFFEQYCEFCYKWLEVIDKFNARLSRQSKPIRKIDIEGTHPLINRFEVEGAPTLVIDGIVIKGVTTEGFAMGFLEGFLEDELVLD